MVVLLLLLLLAAAFGVLGAVIKVTLILVLSIILAILILGFMAAFRVRRRADKFGRGSGSVDASGGVRPEDSGHPQG
jgi:hypothetical protein